MLETVDAVLQPATRRVEWTPWSGESVTRSGRSKTMQDLGRAVLQTCTNCCVFAGGDVFRVNYKS